MWKEFDVKKVLEAQNVIQIRRIGVPSQPGVRIHTQTHIIEAWRTSGSPVPGFEFNDYGCAKGVAYPAAGPRSLCKRLAVPCE